MIKKISSHSNKNLLTSLREKSGEDNDGSSRTFQSFNLIKPIYSNNSWIWEENETIFKSDKKSSNQWEENLVTPNNDGQCYILNLTPRVIGTRHE